MKILLSLFLLIMASDSYAAVDCVPKSEMQVIAKYFTQFEELAKNDYCYDGSDTSALIASMMFMRETQYEKAMDPSKDEIFSGKFTGNWFDYFVERIESIQVDDACPKGVGAYVYSWMPVMYACKMMLTESFTLLDRANIFMHEARHLDGYPHMMCTKGPRGGLAGACDRRISDGGSYAVTVETYAQYARYAVGAHPAHKAYAAASAVIYADEAFEDAARVDRSSQLLALTDDRKFHEIKGEGKSQALGSAPEPGQIVMRAQYMILFPQDLNSKARFIFSRDEGPIPQQAGDIAVEYNEQTPEQRANFVSAHIGAQWSARVYKDKIRFACNPRSHDKKDIALGEEPISILYVDGYDRSAKTIQMMGASGKVYDIGCKAGFEPFVEASRITLDRKYKSVYQVNGLTLGLTEDGYLREIQGKSSRAYSLPALDGRIVGLAPNQSYQFFDERK